MKKYNNKKGFTLIELLAVIVVLALVMVLATTTVLPLMSTARKRTFAMDATNAIDAASNVVALIPLGAITPSTDNTQYYRRVYTEGSGTTVTVYCMTIKELQRLGYYKVDESRVTGSNPELAGKVIIEGRSNTNTYKYRILMKNPNFRIKNAAGTNKGTARTVINEDDVEEYSTLSNYTLTCTTTEQF